MLYLNEHEQGSDLVYTVQYQVNYFLRNLDDMSMFKFICTIGLTP